MDASLHTGGAKEFNVTGVSRSGRVRKKSSKLLDFESPEEFEKKPKRAVKQPQRYNSRGRPSNASREREIRAFDESVALLGDFNNDLQFGGTSPIPLLSGTGNRLLTDGNSDEEMDNLVADLVEGVEAECSTNQSKVRQSLYMREKANKRKILKDGTVVTGKMQRKDKGKTRYTAYSLWARDVRKRDFPELDFSNAARRLGDLWANVSNKEKTAWRRRAKIQATKAKTREKNDIGSVGITTAGAMAINTLSESDGRLLNNRATTNRTKKLAAKRKPPTYDSTPKRNNANRSSDADDIGSSPQYNLNIGRQNAVRMKANSVSQDSALNKGTSQTNIGPIDAAAHLKLLGESLSIIGARLKEHDGQIALSGSLSVLLDSLLCSLGPLLCMTTQIPGLENKRELNINLAKTLDNIAYVMPGL